MNPAARQADDLPSGDDESDGVISAGEQQFDRGRKTIGLFLGPATAALILALPLPVLALPAHRLAAILSLVLVFWITEAIPIPVTALLGAALMPMLGVASAKDALAPFADPIVFLFMGSFILAKAMTAHGLDRRFALRILAIPWVGDSPVRILTMFGAVTAFLSMWLSNTATTAMLFPIALGILRVMEVKLSTTGEEGRGSLGGYGTGLMLMAAYASSIGGIGTPVGTPPNLIGIAMLERLAGVHIPFFRWMLFALPILLLMFGSLCFLLRWLHPAKVDRLVGIAAFIRDERAKLGRWSRGEINALIAFLVAVALWIAPGFIAIVAGTESAAGKAFNLRFSEGIVALLAAGLLFVLPVDWRRREFTLGWREAARIDWGTLLLFGGGLSLGGQMFSTGLATALGQGLIHATGVTSLWGITAVSIALSILITETTSNTAAANMVIPVMIAVAQAAGVNPLQPALGATLGASYAFMLPVSTPPNAIVYGSGQVPITKMLRAGILFDLVGFFLLLISLQVLSPLLGVD
ncbi:MAG: DASS family sodium-coupled anion symporter [Opitutaceae bacterium]|nr:DASS family sodium-coupled anion symporter [Opitutaceae bacterium]